MFATNAYTRSAGWKKRTVVPLRVSLFETETFSDEQRAALGWPGGEGVYTAHEALESYRLTERGTLPRSTGQPPVHVAQRPRQAPLGQSPPCATRVAALLRQRTPRPLNAARTLHPCGCRHRHGER